MFARLFKSLNKKSGGMTPKAPDFIIVGAQKAGTTSLYNALMRHPQFFEASVKEVHYFDFNFSKPKDWYFEQFTRPANKFSGEASPLYSVHPQAVKRIFELVPDVKILFVMRDPVERALSHYRMNVNRGIESKSPLEAMAMEHIRLTKALLSGQNWDTPESDLQNFSYQLRGFYSQQYAKILEFFPAKQIWTTRLESLTENPAEALRNLGSWLGVDSWDGWEAFPHDNQSSEVDVELEYARKYLQMRFNEERNRQRELIPLSYGSW